jgi:hypothetical protein
MRNAIYSIDSAKALKAQSYGYLNGIHYMAPADSARVGNLCSHASPACISLCLGLYSGQASMVADQSDLEGNSTRKSRADKARRFMSDRAGYMNDIIRSTQSLIARAARMHLIPCVRLNGSTDVAYEGIRIRPEWSIKYPFLTQYIGLNIFEIFPTVAFVDYTKNPNRFNRPLPANYHLTFSRSETNESTAIDLLNRGVNVAIVFHGDKPLRWQGYEIIDGDRHDLRQLDPRGPVGTVIGLAPKGNRAKRDTSGFVIRQRQAA